MLSSSAMVGSTFIYSKKNSEENVSLEGSPFVALCEYLHF